MWDIPERLIEGLVAELSLCSASAANRKMETGVPMVVQQKRIQLGTMRL